MKWLEGEPAQRWEDAVSVDGATRKRALDFWARNIDLLPGPITFSVSDAELLTGPWQRIVRASVPRCICGQRRWLTPRVTQPYYEQPGNKLLTLGPGRRYVAIAPWGGDMQATTMELNAGDGKLIRHLMPYSSLSKAEFEKLGLGVMDEQDELISQDRQNVLLLERLAQALKREGSPYPLRTRFKPGLHGEITPFECVPLVVHSVDPEASTAVIAVNRTFTVADTADRSTFHTCA